jgi:hypothetical protein
VSAAVGFVKELPGKVLGALGNLGSLLYDSGKNMIQGLLNGAGSLLRNIGRFFIDLLPGWIVDPFKWALGINSPSKVFAGFGQNIGQGLINGMASMQPAVAAQMAAMANTQALAGLGSFPSAAMPHAAAARSMSAASSMSSPTSPAKDWAPAPGGPLIEMNNVTIGDQGDAIRVAQDLSYSLRTIG